MYVSPTRSTDGKTTLPSSHSPAAPSLRTGSPCFSQWMGLGGIGMVGPPVLPPPELLPPPPPPPPPHETSRSSRAGSPPRRSMSPDFGSGLRRLGNFSLAG